MLTFPPKNTEFAFLSREQFFDFIFKNAPSAQIIFDGKGFFCYSQAFYEMLGYIDAELNNRKITDLIYEQDRLLWTDNINQSITNKGDKRKFQCRFLMKEGTVLYCEVYLSAFGCDNQNVPDSFIHAAIVDKTEEKKATDKLKDQLDFFTSFIDCSRDLIFYKDDKFRHVFVNKKLAEFYGKTSNEIIGKNNYELMNEKNARKCRSSDVKALHSAGIIKSFEKVGEQIFETRKFAVFSTHAGKGVCAYIRNVTEEFRKNRIINNFSEANKIIARCMMKEHADRNEYINLILSKVLKFTNSNLTCFFSHDEVRQEISLVSIKRSQAKNVNCIKEEQITCKLVQNSFLSELIEKRKSLIINDLVGVHNVLSICPDLFTEMDNFIVLPLFEKGKLYGIFLFAKSKTNFDKIDAQIAEVLINGIWRAVEKSEREDEKERLLEQTKALIDKHEAIMLLIEPYYGKIVGANLAATNFYGYSKEELLALSINDINMLDKDKIRNLRLDAVLKSQKYFTFPHRLKDGNVKMVDVYSSPIEYNGKKVLFSIIFDVTEREKIAKENEYLAYHDYLTNAYNRRFFEEEFARKNIAKNFPLTIILGDINGFKMFNDSFGHVEGDKVLLEFANKIQSLVGAEDVFCRIGGDEFAIIVAGKKEKEIKSYVDSIEKNVNASKEFADRRRLSISFGYGIQENEYESLDDLLTEAETFMYSKKYYNKQSVRSNTVNVIMGTLFEKSEREKNHSERVGIICEHIAKKMGFPEEMVNKIRMAGLLHDIGKIGINESILNKEGKLDDSEWEFVKMHPIKGARILENTIEFKDIAIIIASHHEFYNGQGYPRGIMGNDIPIEARIIAVADAYDAMTSERTYRKSFTKDMAAQEIRKCAGEQFDPIIVDVFLRKILNELP